MKRILILLLVLAVYLTGCGGVARETVPDDNPAVSGDNGGAAAAEPAEIGADASSVETAPDSDAAGIDVDITEKMYVTYVNELYVNTEDYIGKMIRIQGMFQAYQDEGNGNTYYYVYRTGPGCCGNDGAMCGFEFTWNGDMPKDNDWIEVVGSLRTYDEDDWTYLTLDARSVTVMKERGAETVSQ